MAANNADDRRKIARIHIRDVLAIEELSLDLDGDGLSISGRMASGKTSILDSVSAAFGKSNRAEMLRQGTERGELLIVLDDGHQIEREITLDGLSRPVVRSPDGAVMKKPADYLAGLSSALALNPVEFLNANEQRQIRMLADAFPVDVSVDELQEWAGGLLNVDELFAKGTPKGLDLVMAAVKQVSAGARNAKLLADKIASQASALGQTIPAGFRPDDVRGISSADLATELARIQQHNRVVQETQDKRVKIDKQEAAVNNQAQQVRDRIKQLEEELAGLSDRLASMARAREEISTWLSGNPVADGSPLEEKLRTLDEQRAILSNYDRMKALESEAQSLAQSETSLAQAKKKLGQFPATMTERASIPIDGLSIEDDGIRVNGLPIGNLSDGERLRLAIQIASAGASSLGVVCIDGAERMSEGERESLLTSLEAQGLQFFITQVSDSDLSIRKRVAGPSVDLASVAPAHIAEPVDATAALEALFAEANMGSALAERGSFDSGRSLAESAGPTEQPADPSAPVEDEVAMAGFEPAPETLPSRATAKQAADIDFGF